jgi:hypothetical protein
MPPKARGRSPGRPPGPPALAPAGGGQDADALADASRRSALQVEYSLVILVAFVGYVTGYLWHSRAQCVMCAVCLLVARLGYMAEILYVAFLPVRRVASSFLHICLVVTFVIFDAVMAVILIIIPGALLIVISLSFAYSFYNDGSSWSKSESTRQLICGDERILKNVNLKAVLEKQSLGQTVSVLATKGFYDSETLRQLNDSYIDTLVRRNELPPKAGGLLKSKRA